MNTFDAKILVVTSTFPAGPDDTVPRFVLDQVRALKRVRPEYSFIVLAPHDSRSGTVRHRDHDLYQEERFHYLWPKRLESLAGHGIMPAIRRNPLQLLAVPMLIANELRAVRHIVKTEKPDLIYAHWFTPQVITCAPIAQLAKIPLVFTTHASDVAVWDRFGPFGRFVVQFATAKASRFTAVSVASLDRMRPFFSRARWNEIQHHSRVIPMGVQIPADASDEVAKDAHTVFFIGRLAEKKGVHRLLEAFVHVHAVRPKARLVIAGDGPLRTRLETQASSLNLDDVVRFVGYQNGKAKDTLYRESDICVLPSIQTGDGDTEGLPVSLLEALSYGKPTIATTATNAGEVVEDGIDAIICRSDDVHSLSTAMLQLMNADSDYREQIGRNARRTAKKYEWTSIAERTADFLLDPLLKSRSQSDEQGSQCAS